MVGGLLQVLEGLSWSKTDSLLVSPPISRDLLEVETINIGQREIADIKRTAIRERILMVCLYARSV